MEKKNLHSVYAVKEPANLAGRIWQSSIRAIKRLFTKGVEEWLLFVKLVANASQCDKMRGYFHRGTFVKAIFGNLHGTHALDPHTAADLIHPVYTQPRTAVCSEQLSFLHNCKDALG